MNIIATLPALATVAYNAAPGSNERLLSITAFVSLFIVGPYTSELYAAVEAFPSHTAHNYSSAIARVDFVLMPTNRKLLKWNETSNEEAARCKLLLFILSVHFGSLVLVATLVF